MPSVVAFVPARAGSQRVPGKNVLPLAGHPLIAYSIASAQESGIFTSVVVSTDSEEIAEVARRYGAEVPGLRPPEIATATSPDVDWVVHVMRGRGDDAFAILRPTSPFRTAATIRRAWEQLLALGDRVDSIRAVELVKQHPGKMWLVEGDTMRPLLDQGPGEVPFHSTQYAALPKVYVQNSSLEIAWRSVLDGPRPSIAGDRLAPFLTDETEGFSIDYPDDVARAELLVGRARRSSPRRLAGRRVEVVVVQLGPGSSSIFQLTRVPSSSSVGSRRPPNCSTSALPSVYCHGPVVGVVCGGRRRAGSGRTAASPPRSAYGRCRALLVFTRHCVPVEDDSCRALSALGRGAPGWASSDAADAGRRLGWWSVGDEREHGLAARRRLARVQESSAHVAVRPPAVEADEIRAAADAGPAESIATSPNCTHT